MTEEDLVKRIQDLKEGEIYRIVRGRVRDDVWEHLRLKTQLELTAKVESFCQEHGFDHEHSGVWNDYRFRLKD